VDVDGGSVPVVWNAVPWCADAVGAEDYDGCGERVAGAIGSVGDWAGPCLSFVVAGGGDVSGDSRIVRKDGKGERDETYYATWAEMAVTRVLAAKATLVKNFIVRKDKLCAWFSFLVVNVQTKLLWSEFQMRSAKWGREVVYVNVTTDFGNVVACLRVKVNRCGGGEEKELTCCENDSVLLLCCGYERWHVAVDATTC
jgi:hypothetical protein